MGTKAESSVTSDIIKYLENEEVEIHEAANLLPQMPQEKYEELRESIAENGQMAPCIFLEGKLLDGRHRYVAADELGLLVLIEHRTSKDIPDPIAYVAETNIPKRELSKAQRALIAAKAKKLYTKLGIERRTKNLSGREETDAEKGKKSTKSRTGKSTGSGIGNGDSRDIVGTEFGVAGKYVDYGERIDNDASASLRALVYVGEISLKDAVELTDHQALELVREMNMDQGGFSKVEEALLIAKTVELSSGGNEEGGISKYARDSGQSRILILQRRQVGMVLQRVSRALHPHFVGKYTQLREVSRLPEQYWLVVTSFLSLFLETAPRNSL